MKEKGQALIILLVGMAIAISTLSAAVVSAIDVAKNTAIGTEGENTHALAESGAEYAILKLLRDPMACSGSDTLTFSASIVTISYQTTAGVCTINSRAVNTNVVKTVQLQGNYDSANVYNLCCWKEVP